MQVQIDHFIISSIIDSYQQILAIAICLYDFVDDCWSFFLLVWWPKFRLMAITSSRLIRFIKFSGHSAFSDWEWWPWKWIMARHEQWGVGQGGSARIISSLFFPPRISIIMPFIIDSKSFVLYKLVRVDCRFYVVIH